MQKGLKVCRVQRFTASSNVSLHMAVAVLRPSMDIGPFAMPLAPQVADYPQFPAPQAYSQPEPSRRPVEQRKRPGKRRGGAGKRKRQANASGAGQPANAPSLQTLQQRNAKGARRFFSRSKQQTYRNTAPQHCQGWLGRRGVMLPTRCCLVAEKEETPVAVTPRTVPHAPLNTTGFLMAQNGVPCLLDHLAMPERSTEATRSHLALCPLVLDCEHSWSAEIRVRSSSQGSVVCMPVGC